VIPALLETPLPAQIPVVRLLTLLLSIVFLGFAGRLTVTTAASLLTRPWRPAVARRLRELPPRAIAAWVVLGVLPLLTLAFLYATDWAGTPLTIGPYLGRILALALIALAALQWHARRGTMGAGIAGLLVLLGAGYHFIATLTLLAFPEKWPFIAPPLPFLFSIQPVVRYGLFLACATVFAGATVLLGRERDGDDSALRRVGGGLVLGGALAAPPLLVWQLYSAFPPTLSRLVFAIALVMVAVLCAAAVLAATMLRRAHARHAPAVTICGIALVALFVWQGDLARANATLELDRARASAAAARYQALVGAQEALYKIEPPSVAIGEQLFRDRCSACHAFDHKVVGPPYDETVPKFNHDEAALASFILNPHRVDTNYPPMPNLGLRPREAQSAAMYLMQTVTGSTTPPAPAKEAP
jgi:mono/diheme cytochrome c family protein